MLATQSLIPAPLVNVQDPTTWLDEPVQFALHRSGEQLTYYPQITSNTSNSSTTFEVSVPALNTIVDRHIYLQMPITIDFAGTAPVGQNLLQTGYDAFRAWPLQACMTNLEISINGSVITQEQNRMIPYLMRVEGFNEYNNFSLSTTPHYMDPSQTYDQLVNTVRNPLGGYGDTVDGTNTPRGAYPMTVVSNTNTAAQVTAVLIEPLFISPLIWGNALRKGLCGIDRMMVKITWSTNLARVWSHSNASGSVFSSPPAVTLGQPQLNLKYVKPQRIYQQPTAFLYGYDSYRIYPTSTGTNLAAGGEQTFTMNNVQLRVVPDLIFLFARKRDADLTYLDADSFAAIRNVNITWGVQNGILAGATESDLYQIARKNGVAMSWETWSGFPIATMLGSTNGTITGAGSILPLRVGVDIPVVAEESPGVSCNVNVTITLRIHNPSPAAVNYDIFLITLDRGTCSILQSRMATETGIISAIGAVEAQTVAPTMLYSHDSLGMYGGGFFDSLWSGIKKAGEFVVDKALPFVQNTVIPGVSAVRSLMGRGFSDSDRYAGLQQYVPRNQDDDNMSIHSYRSDRSDEQTSGGKLISSSALKRRLDKL